MQTTREHLIEVGLDRIYAMGYTVTGVKEILDQAGVPKGSFYHYFPSKEAFAKEVLERYAAQENRRLGGFLEDEETPPLKRLRRYFEEMVSLAGYNGPYNGCMLGNLSLEVAAQSDTIQSLLSRIFTNWQGGIAVLLRSAIERGDLPRSTKADQLAAFLLNSWEGALVRSKAEKSDAPLDTFMHFAFQVLLKK
ncbi:TetR family transcriptional regulator [Granulicella sp. WH15]|uniref:TetR/AcrR family transcriptional regulator n=1 Tax=Granulicella sp. WH15 TaxID=2602070 RepID=UPI001366B8A6|nr:TetR/AcrR family transcriptional regulator [Granulicella sp. WH15]QHN04856.1 TetR family transcriptional regulator [Granulicella sp. WH15]